MIKTMHGPGELKRFRQGYLSAGGHQAPLDFLRRRDVDVYGLYLRGSLAGGFAICRGAPWIDVDAIPDEDTRADWHAVLEGHPAVGVGSVWLGRHVKGVRRPLLLMAVLREVRKSRADRVIVGAEVDKLAAGYQATFPVTLRVYDGPVVDEGVITPRAWLMIFEGPPWTVYFRAFRVRRAVRSPRRRG